MDRFRIAMTLIEAVKVGLATGLAAATTQPPLYAIPPVLAFGAVILIAMLSVISAQMPSWAASTGVAKAATAAEQPRAQDGALD